MDQGYETDLAKNSSDDLWFLDEDNDDDTDTFEVEYELESVASDTGIAISDTDSEIEDAVCCALFLCQDDSDVQFWGDKSEDEGHETSDDPELEGDKWTCKQCNIVNKPTTRYCLKCFDQRVGWLRGADRHPPRHTKKLKRNLSDPGYQSSQSTVTGSQESEDSSLSQESRNLTEKCPLCLERPKTGTIIHGKTAHQAYCYKCARKLQSTRQRCPICRRRIQRVVRNFVV